MFLIDFNILILNKEQGKRSQGEEHCFSLLVNSY